jgi:hypothetical protein
MSAADPLRVAQDRRRRFRALRRPEEPPEAGDSAESPRRRGEVVKCAYRPPDANFFCWKFGVWYNVMDCCYRHDHRTYSGCASCDQGAGNLKAHQTRYLGTRHLGDPPRTGR